MTERFEVPEPTEQAFDDAYGAHHNTLEAGRGKSFAWHNALRAAYEADVPRIVRAEVERFTQFLLTHPKYLSGCMVLECLEEWKAARFGEAAPECDHQWATETTTFGKTQCVRCGKVLKDPLRPTPSAPAVIGLEGGRLTSSPVYTDAERKTLKRIETFCTALARYYALLDSSWKFQREAGVPVTTPPPGTEVTSAAREFLR